ncbi:SRPBCC family protein [Kitasatospora sp. LaBMicrA B282]|uniref:SRPBCC family protein n=1 Tax=Kitasatospora sp. LaBMicrA B282 TaxID=3420949 RepID=UPI003D09D877
MTTEQPLSYRRTIAAPADRVWAAVTTSEGSKATLYGCVIETDFAVGGPVEFVGYTAEGERIVQVYGEVLAYDAPHRFAYRQHPGAVHNPAHAETSCRMSYTVTPLDGGGTELELTVDQWTPGNPAYRHAAAEYPKSAYLDAVQAFAEGGV